MGVGIPEAILRETSLQAFTKSPSNFVVVSVSMVVSICSNWAARSARWVLNTVT